MSNLNPGGLTRVLNYIKTWVTGLLNDKANSSHTHTKSEITDFPTIPTINNATLTIQKNGTTVNSFTANASSNVTANITVPTKVSELSNDSRFLTSHQSLSNYSTLANTVKSLSISGKTITVTPGSGSAYTLTTQDTVYTHPTTAGNKHVPSGGSSGQFLGWDSAGTAKWVNNPNSDTKNTAGSTDTSSKIFLIGATSQAANPQTYSHDTAYVGTDGCLYSGGTKVLTAHQSLSNYSTKANTIRSLSISGRTITYTKDDGTTGTLTTQDTTYSSLPANGGTSTATAYMNQHNTITYGVNRLQYYNISTSTTSGATSNANPTNDWYYHLLMSHGNANGYYGDIALCFHSNTLAFRRIASGSDQGWTYLVKNGRTIVSGYEVYVG